MQSGKQKNHVQPRGIVSIDYVVCTYLDTAHIHLMQLVSSFEFCLHRVTV